MKNLIKTVCLIMVLSLFVSMPAYAESAVAPRESALLASYGTDLYKTSSTSFQIWFDVTANATTIHELGVSEIAVYRSADRLTWTKVKTYLKEDYPEMVDQNTTVHANYVTYRVATVSCYYKARVTFYARNSTGIAERDVYTEIIRMS